MNEENEKLRELVFMAIGEASMCWSEVPSGVFESTRAKKIGDKLMEGISRHQSNPIDPDYAEFKALSIAKNNGTIADKLHEVLYGWFGGKKVGVDYEVLRDELYDAISPYLPVVPLAPKTEAKTENTVFKELENFKKLLNPLLVLELDKITAQYIFSLTRPATLEPLAVLADKQGFSIRIGSNEKGVWFISLRRGHNTRKQVTAPTYAACEQLARTWLEEQKEGV